MTRKALNIFVELNVHAVTCPGVWLEPQGRVMLRVAMLGTTVRTSRVPPVFPLLFHGKFIFQKTLWDVCRLPELQKALEEEVLVAQLVQSASRERLLASFETSLLELLYPVAYRQDLVCGVDVDLLMEPAASFPGILAPKIEVSTKTTIEEVTKSTKHGRYIINPKMVSSKVRKQPPPQMQSLPRQRWRSRKQTAANKSGGREENAANTIARPAAEVQLDEEDSAPGRPLLTDTYRRVLDGQFKEQCACSRTARWEVKKSACAGFSADGSCQVCHAYNKYFNPPSTERTTILHKPSKTTLPSSSSELFHPCVPTDSRGTGRSSTSLANCAAGSKCCGALADLDKATRSSSKGSSSRELFYRDLERFYSKLHRRYQARPNNNRVCS